MAWSCSGRTNKELVDKLVAAKLISSPRVAQAFYGVDRGDFTRLSAYEDAPQSLIQGATITAPHMHANAVETLLPFLEPGANVLDIGCGSGYLLAIFHLLVSPATKTAAPPNPTGLVLGIDHLPDLTALATRNLQKAFIPALDNGTIRVVTADGRLGAPDDELPAGGWDAIHVGAAAPSMPAKLVEQLKSPGRMFIPVGPDGGSQSIWQVDKSDQGKVTKTRLFDVRYVPLTDSERQWPLSQRP